MAGKQHLYLAQAGQMATMSEFLCRGYNVTVPEVDVGDDVFVVRDEDVSLSRVQVKTAAGRQLNRRGDYQAVYSVPLRQLVTARQPDLTFIFPVRYNHRWPDFVVIPRAELKRLRDEFQLGGTPNRKGALILRFVFSATEVTCDGRSLKQYRNNWEQWPVISHG